MSTTTSSNNGSNNTCQRAVDGQVCMIFTIENINDPYYDPASATFDLTSNSGPQITNQQSNAPLKSNGQTALENGLASELGQALANYISGMWNNFYFENGQSFKVCGDFAATIDAVSGGNATADVDIGNVDVTAQNLNY
jgi:hypothetical protein